MYHALCAILALSQAKKCKQYTDKDVDKEFEKIYAKETKEYRKLEGKTKGKKSKNERKKIFKARMKEINKHNKKDASFCQGPNKFAAMDEEEAGQYMGYKPMDASGGISFEPVRVRKRRGTLPAHVDHSDATGPVESQGACKNCWAYAASHSVAGTLALKSGHSIHGYSEMQLTNCAHTGCGSGSDAFTGYKYLQSHDFLLQKDYTGECPNEVSGSKAPVTGWAYSHTLYTIDIDAVKEVLQHQPMAVAMHAGHDTFQVYENGIFDLTDCNPYNLNHDMTLVGYGIDDETGQEYWKIKNSYGTDWGEEGFMRVLMGQNICGVEFDIRYPITNPSAQEPTEPPCVDEAKNCANYGSAACLNDEYNGDREDTLYKGTCDWGTKCRSTVNGYTDVAPWCWRDPIEGPTDWGYCFQPCEALGRGCVDEERDCAWYGSDACFDQSNPIFPKTTTVDNLPCLPQFDDEMCTIGYEEGAPGCYYGMGNEDRDFCYEPC